MSIFIKPTVTALFIGISLLFVLGATRNLPAHAPGIVTGQNEILFEQLIDEVGEPALIGAIVDSDLNEMLTGDTFNLMGEDVDEIQDQLEMMDPKEVYQVAVDTGLLTQAEADTLLKR